MSTFEVNKMFRTMYSRR